MSKMMPRPRWRRSHRLSDGSPTRAHKRDCVVIPLLVTAFLAIGPAHIALAAEGPKDSLSIEVTTDMIAYAPGSEVRIDVTVANKAEASLTATLKVTVAHDLDDNYEVLERRVEVATGQASSATASWTSPRKELWGCEATAALMVEGKRIAMARRVFVVSDDLPKVSANYGFTHPMALGRPTEANLNRTFDCFARHAVPIVEIYSWWPSGWGQVMPDKEHWINGQCMFRESIRDIEGTIEHAHRRGMIAMCYAIPVFRGLAGYRWAKAHPEDARYTTPEAKLPAMSEDQLKAWEDAEAHAATTSYAKLLKLHRWTAAVNTSRNATLDQGVDQYIAAIKRFGFDGIRWDGHPGNYYNPVRDWWFRMSTGWKRRDTAGYDWQGNLLTPDDPDAENLRIIRRVRERIRAALPNVIEGYNVQAWNAFQPDEPELVFANQFPLAYAHFVPGSIMLDEKHFHHKPDGTPTMHKTWSKTRTVLLRGNELLQRFGAYHYTGGMPENGAGPFLLHTHALCYAIGVRPFAVASHFHKYPPEYEPLLTFAQRYARYLFHPSRLRLAPTKKSAATRRAAVVASRPVIFEPFCYYLSTDRRFTIIVHLWNQPVSEKMNVKHCEEPPLVESARVTIRHPRSLIAERSRAYVLSPEWPDQCQPVKIDHTEREVDVLTPAFRYWAIVMLQYPLVPEGAGQPTHHWFLPVQE